MLCVLNRTERRDKNRCAYYRYLCFCGKEFEALPYTVASGRVKSCGCLYLKKASTLHRTHGLSTTETRLFTIWTGIRYRCYNEKNSSYKNYGLRGIKVCHEWHRFENFVKWAYENGYASDLTIERDNVNKDYEPSNCKWIPLSEQPFNRRVSVSKEIILSLRKENIDVNKAAAKYKLPYSVANNIINYKTYKNVS